MQAMRDHILIEGGKYVVTDAGTQRTFVEFVHNRAHVLPFYLFVKEEPTNTIYAFHIDTENFCVFEALTAFFECIDYTTQNGILDSSKVQLQLLVVPKVAAAAAATATPPIKIPAAATTSSTTATSSAASKPPAPQRPAIIEPTSLKNQKELQHLIQQYDLMLKYEMSKQEAQKMVSDLNKAQPPAGNDDDYYNDEIDAYFQDPLHADAKYSNNKLYGTAQLRLSLLVSNFKDLVKKAFYSSSAKPDDDDEKNREIDLALQTLKRNGKTVKGGMLSLGTHIQALELMQHIQIPNDDIEEAKRIIFLVNEECDKNPSAPQSKSDYYMRLLRHHALFHRKYEEIENTTRMHNIEPIIMANSYFGSLSTSSSKPYYIQETTKTYNSLAERKYNSNYNDDDAAAVSSGCYGCCGSVYQSIAKINLTQTIQNLLNNKNTRKKKRS